VLATPGFAAPEQQRGADPDIRQDLYAVGVVGRMLLTGENRPEALPHKPSTTAPSLWALLERLSARDPDDRPVSATEALHRLRHIGSLPDGDDEPPEVFEQVPPLPEGFDPDGPAHRAPHRLVTRRGLVAFGAVAVAVAMGVAAWFAVSAADAGGRPPTAPSTEPTGAATSAPPTTPSPSTSTGAPTRSPGTDAPVVGRPCDFVDVGVRDVARGGAQVTCTAVGTGYRWVAAPS